GDDTPAIRFLLAEAMRPLDARLAAMPSVGGYSGLAWSPDGARFALVSLPSTAEVHDAGGKLLWKRQVGLRPFHPAFSPDGKLLAIACGDGVELRDAATGVLVRDVPAHGTVQRIAFTGDGARFAVGTFDHAEAFEVATGRTLWSIATDVTIDSIAIS